MTYTVFWTQESKKDLQKLEREITFRIIRKVEQIKDNPEAFLKKLVGKKEWRLRIGDYRALIDLDTSKEQLYVIKVGHRKNIYD